MQLENKVIIVTGASSGIGAAAARLLASEGARVVLGARRRGELEKVARQIALAGGEAAVVPGDVTDPDHATRLVDTAISRFGGLDGAFNNAGMTGPSTPVADTPPEDWERVIATNLTSAYHAARAQIPALRGGRGSLVFTGSFIGVTATLPGMGAYAAAKAGLAGFVQALAVEYGPQGIRANALLPGGTRTAIAGDALENPETETFIANLHALKRMAEPDEIAAAALFLLSDAASFVTGSAMLVDGGNSIAKV